MEFNYHTHTNRCRHAFGRDRDYVNKAVKTGIKELGFSDHAPMLFPNKDYYSTFRMFPDDVADYVNSVNRLKQEYKNKINISLGYEIEYYPKLFENTVDYLKQYGFDYLILGQHFTDNEYEPYAHYCGNPTDSTVLFDKYINQALAGIETGKFLYLAHPDLFNFTGSSSVYTERMTGFCQSLRELDCPLEFNLLGYGQSRHYPNRRFWQIAAETGNRVLVAFDAHSPESFQGKKLVGQAFDYLNSLGIKPIEKLTIKKS